MMGPTGTVVPSSRTTTMAVGVATTLVVMSAPAMAATHIAAVPVGAIGSNMGVQVSTGLLVA
jgi:hypothetical protein